MRPDADLSLVGMARIVADFLESLGLEGVTLCFNDWSGGQVMVAEGLMDRVEALVLASCETEGNYPPGLAGQAAGPLGEAARRALGDAADAAPSALRRLPFVYGQMTKRGIPDQLMREWLEPLKRPEIRRDVRKLHRRRRRRASGRCRAATATLGGFERPVLVVWDSEGTMMPNEHGRKLADVLPRRPPCRARPTATR